MTLINDIDKLLPQTQCGDCGYPGCIPYARAIVKNSAPIDRCTPGGVNTLKKLGQLLNIDSTPYIESMRERTRAPSTAIIREEECIGCTKCIQACPVDAIIGTGKFMHSVLSDECTGCGLCLEPCPVDCIEMVAIPEAQYNQDLARERYQARTIRLSNKEEKKQNVYNAKEQEKQRKQEYILQALQRSKMKNSGSEN